MTEQMRVEVRKSSVGPVVALVIGVVAVVAALDMLFFYGVFPEPEKGDEGRLNNQGRSDRRGDIAWGVGLSVAGAGAILWAAPQLMRRRPFLVADGDGLELDVVGDSPAELSWSQVLSVRSTTAEDETGEALMLDIELSDPAGGPVEPRHARWHGTHLLVDADDWRPPVHLVVGQLQVLLERSRESTEP